MNKSTNNKMLVAKATTTSNTFKAIRTQLQFSKASKQERKKESERK